MHVAERQSIPNLPSALTGAAGLPHTIAFDSLKSLPQRDYLQPHYQSQQQPPGVALALHTPLVYGVYVLLNLAQHKLAYHKVLNQIAVLHQYPCCSRKAVACAVTMLPGPHVCACLHASWGHHVWDKQLC